MKKNVFVFSARVLPEHLERLRARFNVSLLDPAGDIDAQFAAAIPEAHGLIGVGRKLGRAQLDAARRLEVVSTISVGYDNYDVDYLSERGILLTNTPGVLTETTADLGFALLMSAARRIPELDAWTRAGQWTSTVGPARFGCDVHGKTLGILGMGGIGAAIARRGHFGFRMPVIYTSNSRKPALEAELNARYRPLDDLLREADFLVVVVPLSADTHHLIGERELALMKPGAILVNIARGPVIDEPALIAALAERRIQAAGLDVYEREPLRESPLFSLPNVVTVPHIGSATHETRKAMAELAIDNLEQALLGGTPQCMVNPQVFKRGS